MADDEWVAPDAEEWFKVDAERGTLIPGVHRSFEVAYAHSGTGRARYWAARRRFKLRHLRLRRRMSRVRELELGLDRARFACLSYHLSDAEIADDVAERLGVRYNWGARSAMRSDVDHPLA